MDNWKPCKIIKFPVTWMVWPFLDFSIMLLHYTVFSISGLFDFDSILDLIFTPADSTHFVVGICEFIDFNLFAYPLKILWLPFP